MSDFNWSRQFYHKDDTYRPHYLLKRSGSPVIVILGVLGLVAFCGGFWWMILR